MTADLSERDGAVMSADATITLTAEQARYVADYWISGGPDRVDGGESSNGGITLETREHLTGTRAALDEYEAKMDAIGWGKLDGPITLSRPRDELVAVAAELLDSGGSSAPGWNDELWKTDVAGRVAVARNAISEMCAGLAIAEQLEEE